jgi:ABC-type Fe3+ transport system permease subunit
MAARSPGVVFTACLLLAGVAAARLTACIGAFYALPQISRHYSDSHGDSAAGAAAGVGVVAAALISLVGALLYLLLAYLDSRGMNPARVLTWLLAAVTVAGTVTALALDLFGAVPWFQRLAMTTDTITLAFTLAATVLLALPPAQRFFRIRKQARVYVRPGYPHPGYPPPIWPNPPGPGPGRPPGPGGTGTA